MSRRYTKPLPIHHVTAFLVTVIWYVSALVPTKIRWYLGSAFGSIIYLLSPKRRKIVRKNLELCFPTQSESDRNLATLNVFKYSGFGVLNWGFSLFASDQKIEQEVDWYGRETLEFYCNSKESIILLCPHFVSPLLTVRTINLISPTVLMYQPPTNPLLDMGYKCALTGIESPSRWVNWFYQKKSKYEMAWYSRQGNMRPIFRALDEGIPFFYLPDQNANKEAHRVFAPFFGVQAATYTALTRFAQFRDARIFICFAVVANDNRSFEMHTELLPKNFITGDRKEDATRLNQTIENLVRQVPEQYFWLHRRFKTRPEGEAPIY